MQRTLSLSLLAASGFVLSLSGCGARSGLLEQLAEGGAAPIADPRSPSLPAMAGGAPAATEPGSCVSETVAIDDLRPAVTLLVDQSGSMGFAFPTRGSPETRWSVVGAALFDPNFGVVKAYQDSVRFGITFFTSHNGFAGGACPIISEVHAATGNYDALYALYQSLRPDDDTPTGESIDRVVSELKSTPSAGPHSIVVVTDGTPDTCDDPTDDMGQPEAVAAAQRAYAAGYDLYVLGISNDIAEQNLQQLANAGKGEPIDLEWGVDPDAAQPFNATSDVKGLSAQFGDILNHIPLCEVRLTRDVVVGEASTGRVVLDGRALAYSSSDGYTLKDARHLEIVGAACQAVKAGGKELSVRISCD